MRKATSLTLDRAALDYAERTRRGRSRSERVNELLQRGIELERARALEAEAAAFFARVSRTERAETRAFRAAGARTLARD